MKLALVIPGYQADAHDWCIPAFTNLAHELAKSVELHVFTLRYPGVRRDYNIGSVNVHAIGGGALLGRRIVGASLFRLWRDTLSAIEREHAKSRFDAIMGVWATESGWLATVAAKRLGLPSLVHLAGGELVWLPDIRYGNRGRGLSRLLVRRCLRSADLLTAPSGPMQRALLKYPGVSPDKVRRWALGVDTQMFKPGGDKRATGDRPFTFVTTGSLIPVKGHSWLISAMEDWAEVASHDTPLRLKVVGDGPLLPELRAMTHRLDLEGYVVFTGEISHDDLPRLYADADCFLLGSRHEAQCMAALEAMACGLPWIAPPVGALADLAQPASGNSPSGILIKDRTLFSLLYALQTMLDATRKQRAIWGKSARRRVLHDYDLQIQTASLLALLENIL